MIVKVRFIGFSFELNSLVPLNEFILHLSSQSGEKFELNNYERMLFIDSSSNTEYLLGLLITIKDQKTFCQLSNEGDTPTIIVNEIAKKSDIMDFNFFVLNKSNGLGLYQYYHQSCSFNKFGYIASKLYHDLKESKSQFDINDIKTRDLSEREEEKQIKTIKKKYNFRLNYSVLIRPDSLVAILQEYKRIKAFEFDYAWLEPEENAYTLMKDLVKKEHRRLSFVQASVSGITSAIVKSLSDTNISNGRVIVQDYYDNERIVEILNNPDKFGEYDFDHVAYHLNSLKLDNIKECWVIKELLNTCAQKSHIFSAKIGTTT